MQVVDASGNMFGYDSITVAGPDGKPKTLSSAIKLITLVRNTSGSTMTKGTVVYINGGSGNKPTIARALATSDATSAQTYGVVQANIPNNKNGYVVVVGALEGVNTSAYTPGTQLYLSSTTAGQWTSTKQLAPAHLVYVGIVVRQHVNQGVVEVKIQNGYELDEIHDVSITTPLNNQVLQYESATSLWKNKTISTGITIGSTAIASGVVGRVLFEGAGNVVQESPSIFWDIVNNTLNLGSLGVQGELVINRASTGGSVGGVKAEASGAGVHIGGGGYLDSIILTNGAGVRINTWAGSGSVSTERLRVTASTGNVLVNTTTDSGFKFDVNGTARVVNQLQVGSFTVGGGASSSIVTQGRISASGGITLYNPAAGDNQDTGIFPIGGVQIKHANSSVATFATVGGATSGTNVAINQGYNPGAGTGSVIGYSHSYALYPSADNTVSYTSYYSRPSWNSSPFYNRITGPIRGFLFSNGLYNTQKLVDVVAFQSDGGRLLFTGDLPAASATSNVSRGLYLNQTHTASANNDVLVGLDIAPTYTNGAFTGLANIDLRTKGAGVVIGSGAGYGAVYGYNNDGLFQFSTSGTNSVITLRPNNTAANYNSSYWSYIIQENYSFKIIPGNYQSLYLRNYSVSGAVYVGGRENANSYGIYIPSNTANVLINTTTDAGYKLDVNGTIRSNSVIYANQFFGSSGTASAPSLAFNTGWGLNFASNRITFVSGSNNRGYFDSAGNFLWNENGSGAINFTLRPSNGQTSNLFVIQQNPNQGSAVLASINGSGGAYFAGDTLIGTNTAAGYKLDVNGTARIKTNDTSIPLNVSHSGSVGIQIEANANGYRMRLASTSTFSDISTPDSYLTLNQSGQRVVVGSSTIYNSAQLAVDSTTRGFLPPRMTTTEKNAIASPAAGLVVYDTTLNKLCVYTTAWETVTSL